MHNYIQMFQENDSLLNCFNQDRVRVCEIDPESVEDDDDDEDLEIDEVPDGPAVCSNRAGNAEMGQFRDVIAAEMWNAYQVRPW